MIVALVIVCWVLSLVLTAFIAAGVGALKQEEEDMAIIEALAEGRGAVTINVNARGSKGLQ